MYCQRLGYHIIPIDKKKVQWYLAQIESGKDFDIPEAKNADIVFHWDYRNENKVSNPVKRLGLPIVNEGIRNVKKDFVDKCFTKAFGYSTFLDPATYRGKAVMKTTRQATHDAQIIDCPQPRAGRVYAPLHGQINHYWIYQKLINNSVKLNGKVVYRDYRVPIIDKEIPLVWYKDKNEFNRFEPLLGKNNPLKEHAEMSVSVEYDVDKAFTREEQRKIKSFCKYFGGEFFDIDIVRDQDGKIYILDVNNIAAGALFRKLSEADRIASLDTVALQLQHFLENLIVEHDMVQQT
jgi:hypothetical protein